jgi:ribose 5-phosphate isomerase RpiB
VTVALVVSSNFTGDKGVVTKLLSDMGFRVNDVSGQGYESAVKKLAAAVVSGGSHFGICIENSGMEGPIFANRNDKARAVHCRSTIEARAARIDYGANVIVIDAASDPSAVIQGFCGM